MAASAPADSAAQALESEAGRLPRACRHVRRAARQVAANARDGWRNPAIALHIAAKPAFQPVGSPTTCELAQQFPIGAACCWQDGLMPAGRRPPCAADPE